MIIDQGCGVGVGVGVGVDKIYRLRARSYSRFTNRYTHYVSHFSVYIFVVDQPDDKYRTQPCAVLHSR